MSSQIRQRDDLSPFERRVRAITKAERRIYLRAYGWRPHGRDHWLHPTHDQPDGDHALYTWAAAIRTALEQTEP